MISKTSKATSEITDYTYDSENRLIEVDKPGMIATYKYDGLRRRIEKNVDGAITRYVYDDVDILFEFDGNNSLVSRYTFSAGIDNPLVMETTGNSFYYLTDGLGSITELTDTFGDVVQTYVYDSFGKLVSQSGSIANPFKFTAREYDSESELYYYRARYYDSTMGRFIQEDPIDFQGGVNFYSYVGNSPTNFIDPLGLRLIPLVGDNPPPTIPLPNFGGCFGTLGFFNLSWVSTEPTKTFFSLNGAALGGGFLLCYKIKCDVCPGADPGPPAFGLGGNPFGVAFGIAVGISKDTICFAFGLFGSFTPFNINVPIGSF